jgi:1-aminocyclopropane-1-carboxylate deaminase/D-cysteine desulfhydrase-like pyridoxal-dependent ACC family enzyme
LLSSLNLKKAIIQPINLPLNCKVNLFLLRLDLIDEEISGNKWFKLKYNLEEAIKLQKQQIITFGGAFSNHIAATSKACKLVGLKSYGIIRGENIENHTLNLAEANGMELKFVSRTLYRNKMALMEWLAQTFDLQKSYVIPEGGANELGIEGCKEIVDLINIPFNYIAVACGTATTLTGVIKAINKNQIGLGFAALKGGSFLTQEVNKNLSDYNASAFKIFEDYHFGGYAKHNDALITFMRNFEQEHHIKLDFVYTAKMMYGLLDLIHQNYFPANSTIVAIHSGGLQGNLGLGI